MRLLKFCIAVLIFQINYAAEIDEITPYKFANSIREEAEKSTYVIPAGLRFTVERNYSNAPDIIYYFSKPKEKQSYPIAIVCGGSSLRNSIASIIHCHRYFLQEFLDLGVAVLTVEQWGVDGKEINEDEFIEHYTRTQRLEDHKKIVEHIKANPPHGWDGTLVFLGVSEGGPLVTSLTQAYSSLTRATINWCGADGWPWQEELWVFIVDMRKNEPWWLKLWELLLTWMPFAFKEPKNKQDYDKLMNEIRNDCTTEKEFMGMTYAYHVDAMNYPEPEYEEIKTPFLVVAGAKDSIITSCDEFVAKAKKAGVPITYERVEGMDHYIRCRPDIIERSFEWLKEQIQ